MAKARRRARLRLRLAKGHRSTPGSRWNEGKGPFKYWLPAGTEIKRSKSRTLLPGMPEGWEDFTTTRDALFTEDDLVKSPINDMVVVRIPELNGGVRPDGWQSIQFDFLQLKIVVDVKHYGANA